MFQYQPTSFNFTHLVTRSDLSLWPWCQQYVDIFIYKAIIYSKILSGTANQMLPVLKGPSGFMFMLHEQGLLFCEWLCPLDHCG